MFRSSNWDYLIYFQFRAKFNGCYQTQQITEYFTSREDKSDTTIDIFIVKVAITQASMPYSVDLTTILRLQY